MDGARSCHKFFRKNIPQMFILYTRRAYRTKWSLQFAKLYILCYNDTQRILKSGGERQSRMNSHLYVKSGRIPRSRKEIESCPNSSLIHIRIQNNFSLFFSFFWNITMRICTYFKALASVIALLATSTNAQPYMSPAIRRSPSMF